MDRGPDLVRARELHRAGRLAEARAAYELLLEAAPEDIDVAGLLGVLALQEGRHDAAEALLRRGLEGAGDARIRLRNLNNLVVLLRETGRGGEVPALLGGALPEWPAGRVAEAAERRTVLSLIEAFVIYDQPGRARDLLEAALPQRTADAEALNLEGRILLAEGDARGAVDKLEMAVALAPHDPQPLMALAATRSRLGETASARDALGRLSRGWPVYIAPPRPSQRARLLVINPSPKVMKDDKGGLRALHFALNYPSEFATTMADEYRFLSIFGDLPAENLPEQLPKADLVLNNLVNAEALNVPGRLERVRALVRRLGLPVINPPDAVAAITRQRMPQLLAGVRNLRLPRIARYRTDPALAAPIADNIEKTVGFPAILRHTMAHQSSSSLLREEDKAVVLVRDRAAVRAHIETCGWPEFYAVEFIDLQRPDGFYRKIRVAVAGDEIVVIQVAFNWQWAVSGWRRRPEGIAFYRANPATQDESVRIVRNPEGTLGSEVMQTLRSIRERLPLDVFGMDFDVDRDGQVVLFEATASMVVHASHDGVPEDLRLPAEARERFDDSFRRLVAGRLAEVGRMSLVAPAGGGRRAQT